MRPKPVDDLEDARLRLSTRREAIRALGAQRLAIFGSLVHGSAGPSSDVDVLVFFAPGAKRYDRLLQLADLLEEAFGRPVDIVTPEGLSPHIGPHIRTEAVDVLDVA